jgi:predicted dinucleotide-binding enzyme
MKIAVIGAGRVGSTLGGLWAARGHGVTYGVRDPGSDRHKALLASGGRVASNAEAVRGADVVLLATPWDATEAALRAAGDLGGRVLIDAVNPIILSAEGLMRGLEVGHTNSAAEHVARWAPGARVVKAFNTIGAENMKDPRFEGQRATMFLCGDDAAAKRTAAGLAEEIGFEPVDAGPLTSARLLEALGMLWIHLGLRMGMGTGIAFRLLRRAQG